MTKSTPSRGHAPIPRPGTQTAANGRSARSTFRARSSGRAPAASAFRSSRRAAIALASFEILEGRRLLSGNTFYVSPNGSDTNAGTADYPFQTIQAAADVAGPGDTVSIHRGTYREAVTPAHSGQPGAPITFQPYGDGTVIVSGADVVNGWQQTNGSIYQAPQTWDLGVGNNEVFVDGTRVTEARWPSTGLDLSHPTLATAESNTPRYAGMGQMTTSTLHDSALTQPAGFWNGATIDILPGQAWVGQTGQVISSWPGGLTYKYQQMNVPYALPSAGDHYYLFGKAGALDAPGEWSLDSGTGALSLRTPGSDDPGNHTVEVKRRQDAFNLTRRSYVTIQGLEIFAATIVTNSSSNNITLDGLDARYVSQFALDANGWNEPTITGIQLRGHNSVLENSVVEFSAGNGVFLDGSDNAVMNCVIHDVDTSATVCSGVEVWGARMRVEGNTIYNAARGGVKLSNSSQTLVLRNLIHDVMLQTTDGGAIYTYGSDGAGGEIGYNRIYNVHSAGFGAAGLYLDNSSSHFLLDHNVVSNCDWALKLNPPSRNNQIKDNVLANSGAPLDTSGTKDMSGTVFAGNIYNGSLKLGRGAADWGNTYQDSPAIYDPSNGGAHVDDWAITPPAQAPSPKPRPPQGPPSQPSPKPKPAPIPPVAPGKKAPAPQPAASSRGYSALYRAFLTWHKTHQNVSQSHSDFYVFVHSVYHGSGTK